MPDPRPTLPYKLRASYGAHFLHHLTADRAGLAAGQFAVVAILEVYADLSGRFHLKLIHCGACFGNHTLIRTVFRVSPTVIRSFIFWFLGFR